MSKPTICMTLPTTLTGKKIKKHIYDVYNEYYGASISSNPDIFIYIEDNKGICAAFGIKFAKNGKLFSEAYLQENIEDIIKNSRETIVEVSNCISLRKGYGGKLYKLLASILDHLDIDYALVTLTDVVQRIFNKLDFKIGFLCDADVEKIGNKEQWGSFYNTKPKTFTFNVKQSVKTTDKFNMLSQSMGVNIAPSLH